MFKSDLFKKNTKKPVIIIIGILVSIGVIFLFARKYLVHASPSQIVDSSTGQSLRMTSNRRVIRTTSGTGGHRVFANVNNGTDLVMYYSDNTESASPSWTALTINAGTTFPISDMVWDETNDVIYIVYCRNGSSNSSASDVYFRRMSNLGGSPPTMGAQQIALNGTSGATTYGLGCNVEIAGDSGTSKVVVWGDAAASGGSNTKIDVAVGTLNTDTPSFGAAYTVKSWTAFANAGLMGVSRVNTNKAVMQYYDGVNIIATRHDDSSSATASSGWDALDGTDNSQTTLSSDVPTTTYSGNGSIVGSWNSDIVWFSWIDAADDINTRRWSGTALDSEMTAVAATSQSTGGTLTTDGSLIYMAYRKPSGLDSTVFQSRPISDGTSAWSGVETILDTGATGENQQFTNVAKKLYQGHLDVLTVSSNASSFVRHASGYKIAGNVYQESASSPYDGSTVWSGCDNATLNVAISVAGGTKANTWCDSSTGAFNFVLAAPTGADADITLFLDTAGGDKATLITHNADAVADLTGLKLYKNRIWIQSESSTSVTNADINSYDQSNDSDILIGSDGTNATADSGTKIVINTGDTYAPGGNVTAPKLQLKGTYTGATETLSLNGAGTSSSCDATLSSLATLCLDGGTFTASSNTVSLTGADATTQTLIGNFTFNNLSIPSSGNAAGRTIRYTGSSTTTVTGTWTVTGASGKVITLQSSDTNQWTINPTAAAVTYVSVSRSTNTGVSFCAVNSTDGGNNSGWTITGNTSCTPVSTEFTMQTGYYLGTGTDNRAITGIGFQPNLVLIKDETTNGTRGVIFKTSAMAGEISTTLSDAESQITVDGIQSLDADGFTLGTITDVNGANIRYTWTAFGNSSCTAGGSFCVGSYTGDGTASQAVTSVGFPPDLAVVKTSASATGGRFRTSSMADNVGQAINSANEITDGTVFKTLDATGFTVGSSTGVNAAATTMYYFAFRNVTNKFAVGSFTGDGLDNRSITSPGFRTQAVWIKNANATTPVAAHYNITESDGDYSTPFADLANATGVIKSLDATGFTVGTDAGGNESGKTLYWIAFGGASTLTGTGTFQMKVGTYTGNGTAQSITGVGFAPDLVIVKEETGSDYAVYRTRLMKGDLTFYTMSTIGSFAGGITTLDGDGFTLGADATVNTNAVVYMYQAFGNAFNPETNGGAGDFMIGAYTGNGLDNRDIIRLPFQPDLIYSKRGSQTGILKTSEMTGDLSGFVTNNAEAADLIQAIGSTSFQVGTDTKINNAGGNFYFYAFKAGAKLKVGSYTGTGSTQTISAPGFLPDLVWVKSTGASYAVMRPSTDVGDISQYFYNNASATDRITSLVSSGFTVGGNQAQSNAPATTYRYIAWTTASPAVPVRLNSGSRFFGRVHLY